MTRSDLVANLARQFPTLLSKDVAVSVSLILDAIEGSLVAGDRVELRGFGVFSVHQRPPRNSRNPKTGEAVWVPAKRRPHFKPGKDLAERVDGRLIRHG